MSRIEVFQLFAFKEDALELIEAKAAITSFIVLIDDRLDFIHGNLATEFLHRKEDILLGDLARRVRIKLIEYSPEARVSEETMDINCRCKELRVVDHVVTLIVSLADYIAYLLALNIDITLSQDIS